MNQDKLIAEWMNQLRSSLSRCLIEELKKVDLSGLLRMTQMGAAAAEKPVEAPPEPTPETELHQPRHREPGICATEGCDRPARARGLCARHYQREQYAAKRGKAITEPTRQAELPISVSASTPQAIHFHRSSKADEPVGQAADCCAHPDCEKTALKKGLCGKHFMAWVRASRRSVG